MEEEKDKTQKQGQISRREFLKDAGLIVGGATVGSMAMLNACSNGGETTKTATSTITKTATTTVATPGETGVTTVSSGGAGTALNKLKVNGTTYELAIEPNWTLAWVLREN